MSNLENKVMVITGALVADIECKRLGKSHFPCEGFGAV